MDTIEIIGRLTSIIHELTDVCRAQAEIIALYGIETDRDFYSRIAEVRRRIAEIEEE